MNETGGRKHEGGCLGRPLSPGASPLSQAKTEARPNSKRKLGAEPRNRSAARFKAPVDKGVRMPRSEETAKIGEPEAKGPLEGKAKGGSAIDDIFSGVKRLKQEKADKETDRLSKKKQLKEEHKRRQENPFTGDTQPNRRWAWADEVKPVRFDDEGLPIYTWDSLRIGQGGGTDLQRLNEQLPTDLMAFFGLTALGPQNSFAVHLQDVSYLDIFTSADVDEAFRAVDHANSGDLGIEQVEGFLTALYRGEPKDCDRARFMGKISMAGAERFKPDDIRSVMIELNQEVEEEKERNKWHRGSGSDFDSNRLFREKIRRHEHIVRGPRERYAKTVTAVQEHGWNDQRDLYRQTVRGKKSCPETVYTAELVKSGVYF